MAVNIKSYNQILGPMVKKMLSDTAISDMRVGSVISSLLEAAAQSDFEIHASIVEMLKLFSIDTIDGADLDLRAAEFNVRRLTASPAYGVVRVSDSSITKKSSKIYIGLPPPVTGDVTINVEDASAFPLTGSVYIGRGTGNYEGPIAYTAVANNTSYWTITLATPVTKVHTAVETVILSQGGNRVISAGNTVKSPANNFSPSVTFVVTRSVTLVDGETTVDGVPVIAQVAGTSGNVPAGAIVQFSAAPFTGATVTNPAGFINGRDLELAPSLRARIRNAIQLLARGTKRSILEAVKNVSDETDNKRVASASLSEPISATVPAQLTIDDSTGFEPSFNGQGVEKIVNSAAGFEERVQIAKFPITPPILISASDQPYGIQPGDTLTYRVDSSQETIVFEASDMAAPGLVKASEVIDTINRKGTLIIARSVRDRNGVALVANRFPDGTDPEELQVLSGAANDSLQFPMTVSRVLSLYKNGVILRKNAASGVIYSDVQTTWSWSISTVAVRFLIKVDNTPIQDVVFRDSDFTSYGTTYQTATAAQWAEQIAAKVAGITATVESSKVKVASNKTNSTSSRIEIFTADDLGSRPTTAAVWQSGFTTRYSVANTDGIIVGDTVTTAGFANALNNGAFVVTRVAPNDYVECTTLRNSSVDDETGVIGATIDPNKEDLTLVAFGGAQVSEGVTSEYKLNRFSGELELPVRLSSGDNLTAGSEFTKAYVDSIATANSRYNFPVQQDVNAAVFVAIDSNSSTVNFNIANGDVLTQGRVIATNNVELKSNRSNAFASAQVGDFVYIATKSTIGTGVGYDPWFPSYATGVYEITQLIDDQTVYIRNPDPTFPSLPTVITGNVSSLDDVQIFRTDGLVQKLPLSGVNLLPSAVITQLNSVIQFGEAVVFNNTYVRLQSNSLNEDLSKVYILATAGSGKNLYTAGTSGTPNQPHIGFQSATTESTTFPRLINGLYGLLVNREARGIIFGSATASDLTAPYVHEDSTKTFLTDIKVDDVLKYNSGNNNQQILALRSIDSNTELTPQSYSGIRPIYEGDSYLVAESHKFSPYDRLIVELDQDSTNKTFLIPMYRTGRVKGVATTTTFDAYDMDSAPGTDFNDALWRDFSFRDFSVMMRSRNVYKPAVANASMIIRSAKFGEVGNSVKFGIFYPSVANQAASAQHEVLNDRTEVSFYLASGAPRTNISAVGAGYKLTRAGNLLTLDYAGVGAAPNFSGNGVVIGDIASITDSKFSSKSPYFYGAGKVTSVSATQLVVKLQGSATINTSYGVTAVQDSGAGLTSTYLMPNTGLIALNDTVEISGFTRSINNGVFTVVGVTANTSITVSHSIRSTISFATTGYRRTSNAASIQFAGSLTGQVQVGDSVVVSNMSEVTLNGTFTVTALSTNVFTNDTITFTAAGIDLPVARTVTSAIWQSGNTVRYACTNTGGISIGNTVVISGFVNGSNNGTFPVTNVSNNNWIEVTTSRVNNTDDEAGPVSGSARPTYYVSELSGIVKVINAEVAAATADLILTQASATGIAAFPLAGTTASSVATTLAANPFVSQVVTAVNVLGSTGAGALNLATFDEASSVGYNHSVGDSFIDLYDGKTFVLDFYSAVVNPQKNFTLKEGLQFSHPDYDISTAPNITGEQAGEYFRLVPTTFRNIEDWFNKSSVTSFLVVGSALSTADGGRLQLATQTIGTEGATKISGGSANGINSYIKAPASVDTGVARVQVNNADASAFIVGQMVKVENTIASRKPGNFVINDLIDVQNVNGTVGRFKARPRVITLAATNSITITDVSVSYTRSAGKVWRWTVTGTPSAAFNGAKVGDVLMCQNANINAANRTSTSTGDGYVSFFPILSVDEFGDWIEVHNPTGVAEGPTLLGATVATEVSPAFFIEWKHLLDATATMKVEALEFRNLFKYSWLSGAQNPRFAENGVCVDDYVSVSGNSFLPENRGTFRVVAVDDDYFVVENDNGSEEPLVDIDVPEDVRFFYSESAITGDRLNVSDLPFLEPNRGSHTVLNYGTDATLKTQYLTLSIVNSSNQTSVPLTGLPNTFFITDGQLFSAYRRVENFGVDPSSIESAVVYLSPATNAHKISNSFNSSITPIQKLGFSSATAIGVDGYRYYTGLLATVQKIVDGYDPDPINYPGYKAAGTQIEVVPPLTKDISVNISVKTSGGINISAVSDAIKSAIINYIRGLGVGEDVIVSEITAAAMSVDGVESATLFDPSPTEERIVIQDKQKAVINIDDVTISSN